MKKNTIFIFHETHGVLSMGPGVTLRHFCDLTDVTLADGDTNSIQNDDDNKTILGIIIFASGVTWWPKVREKLILQIYVVLKCLVLLVTEKI